MNVHFIERNEKPKWAVVPYETYLQLVEQAEMLLDIRDYDASKAALAKVLKISQDELVSSGG
jgi:hypothetical protein